MLVSRASDLDASGNKKTVPNHQKLWFWTSELLVSGAPDQDVSSWFPGSVTRMLAVIRNRVQTLKVQWF